MLPSEKQLTSQVGQQVLHFGALLKTLRYRYGLKQLDILAQLNGWTQTAYSRLESGELAPAFDQLPTLYFALHRAGVAFTPQDRRQFVTLAHARIEAKRSHQEHRTEREWDELRLTLARAESKTDEQDHASLSKPFPSSSFLRETRHLIGREDWLRSVLALLDETLPKKLVVLQGPVGVGKSSELHRLAAHLLRVESPRTRVVLCDLPVTEHDVEPESMLDIFLATILAEAGTLGSVMPSASLNVRILFALEALKQSSRPLLLLLDNAEHLLDKRGRLTPCWEQFLAQFLRCQHHATLFMATKEWHGWPERDGQFIAEITVPLLKLQDSVSLLQRLGLESVSVEHLQAVSERVAGIPLCLEWVARLAQDPWELDEWWNLSSKPERDEQDHPGPIAERILRLLEEPALLGEHLATHLTPLLQRILDNHLSQEARDVLEHLSVVTVPLGEAALQQFCPRPGLLKELRDASLLTISTGRVQLLPMVAALVETRLSRQQRQSREERMILALTHWLDDGHMSNSEAGAIIAELGILYLRHHRLLNAAQLLTRFGWLSFNIGHGPRLARQVTEVITHSDPLTTEENEWGGCLLEYLLSPFLGKTIQYEQQTRDYQRIQNAITAKSLSLQPLMDVNVTHQVLLSLLNKAEFEEALSVLGACCARLEPLQVSLTDLQAALLEERALLFARWSEYVLKQREAKESRTFREQAIELYRKCIQLLSTSDEQSPLRVSMLKRSLARCLNNLSYHLNSIGLYEEALEMAERGIALKEMGYAYVGALAASYGEKSQILAALGRFREALIFDEKAIAEVRRCADTGDTLSQEELWIYHINRGRLYLRLGKVEEAEQLIREALPHVHPRRRVYQMFAEDALQEIEQWHRKANALHHQLDWRWIERFRALDAFDAYWWWAQAGPFTEEEQQQWNQISSSGTNEATKAQLGKLIAQSRDSELANAIAEQREPRLHYPAIDIDEVRQRITALLQLDNEVSQEEPNPIVRRLYHDKIEEEMWFLRMLEATYEDDNERFWEFSRRMYSPPTMEAMNYALSQVRQALIRGVRNPETAQMSQDFMQLLGQQFHLSFDLLAVDENAEEAQPPQAASSSGQPSTITAQAAKRFFKAVLRQSGYEGWQVEIDPKASGPRVEAGLRTMFLQENEMTLEAVKHYLAHELAGHVARSVAGEHSSLGLLAIGTKNYSPTEEGIALYRERQIEELQGGAFDDWGAWFGTLVTGLASGVATPPQTFLSLFTFLERFFLLWRLVEQLDEDRQSACEKARRAALSTCLRVYRGVPDLRQAGICLNKDAVYLRGLWLVERAVAQDATIVDRLAVGKVAMEYLPDLQELAIDAPPQPLQKLLLDPHLDAYINSFENTQEHSN